MNFSLHCCLWEEYPTLLEINSDVIFWRSSDIVLLDIDYKPGMLSVQLEATCSTKKSENYSNLHGWKNICLHFITTFPSLTILISSFIPHLILWRHIIRLKKTKIRKWEHDFQVFLQVASAVHSFFFSRIYKMRCNNLRWAFSTGTGNW